MAKIVAVTTDSAIPITKNGAGIPNGATRKAESTGPAANPPTSHDNTRPRLRPRFSGSLTMMTRRMAGSAQPSPTPEIKREPSNSGSESENAMAKLPTMARDKPIKMSWRERPRSAIGAMVIWAKNEVKKPIAITNPSDPSLIPNCSR